MSFALRRAELSDISGINDLIKCTNSGHSDLEQKLLEEFFSLDIEYEMYKFEIFNTEIHVPLPQSLPLLTE